MYTFSCVTKQTEDLVRKWLAQDYVNEWFHGVGLENTLSDLANFTMNEPSRNTHWIAFDGETPFAYLLTSKVEKSQDDPYFPFCLEGGEGITLDLLIGNREYLGKGIAHKLILTFLITQFPNIRTVLIDPQATNTRAVHVYGKAGFKIIGEFIAKWHPVPHYMMRLDMKELKR